MATIEHATSNLFADKDGLRRMMTEQNEKMGFVRVPGATALQAREMMQATGIRPEDNEATRELKQARDEDNLKDD